MIGDAEMDTKKMVTVVVEYYSDPTRTIDDHNADHVYLTEVSNREFKDVFEAIQFLQQCTSPITDIIDIVPLIKRPKGFKFILPERNIKIKHRANGNIDSMYNLDDEFTWE